MLSLHKSGTVSLSCRLAFATDLRGVASAIILHETRASVLPRDHEAQLDSQSPVSSGEQSSGIPPQPAQQVMIENAFAVGCNSRPFAVDVFLPDQTLDDLSARSRRAEALSLIASRNSSSSTSFPAPSIARATWLRNSAARLRLVWLNFDLLGLHGFVRFYRH